MESPEGDRIKAASSTTPASSPAVQESPFLNFISNLSPINSVKAARSTQRFSYTQFPTPPPVFRTPRLDPQREMSFLKSDEVNAASTDAYGGCGNRLSTVLVPCMKKDLLSCSPSGCVDDYLTEPVEAEGCANPNDLCVQPAKNVSKLSRSGFTAPIINITKVDDANDRNSEEFMHIFLDQAEVDPLRSLILFETASDEKDAERFDGLLELTPKERANQVESNGFLLSSVPNHEQYVSQDAGIQHNGQDGSSQSPENLQNVEADKNSSESLVPVSKGSVKESTLHQRGIRRHLQFEAALAGKGITSTKSHSSHVTTQESDHSALPTSLRNWDCLIPSDVESREISSSREATSSSHNLASRLSFSQSELARSSQHDGSLSITGPFSYGFGLHSSSIAESVPMSSDLPSKILPSYMSSEQDKLIPEDHIHFQKDSNSCLISNVAGKIHAHMDKDLQDDQAVVGASSVTTQYTDSMKLLCDSMEVALYEQQAAPCEGMMLTSENTDRVEEINQVSPKKKRKKATYNSESEGCKRCNCKRSRCLKLYCECFAASVYCIDSCACESCFNKPEYEETVTDMRQQIESRNPLAFAPKIVNHATDSPANVVEVGNLTTPASARHKRGCNCKKSKCLKKYCECFQANVGCSDGCRCEGCCNSFGQKTESKYRRAGRWENQSHVKLDAAVTVTDSSKAGTVKQFSPRWEEGPDMSHLTPLSYSCPGAEASSASPNTREYQNVPRPQLHHQSSFKSSAVNLHWHSPMSFTPQSHKNNAEHEHCSDGAVQDRTKEDNIHKTQNDITTPTNESKAGLPSKKLVSKPQVQSQELRSSSSPGGLQSGRKFILQTMPSFPPLTPYSKSKDDIGQTESDLKGDPSDN